MNAAARPSPRRHRVDQLVHPGGGLYPQLPLE
jgi:hypothetical protein